MTNPQKSMTPEEAIRLARLAIGDLGANDALTWAGASGGMVWGYSHSYSDLDVYAVPRGRELRSSTSVIEGIPVQVNIIDPSTFEAIASCYQTVEVSPTDNSQLSKHAALGKLASRIVTALDVLPADDGPREALLPQRNAYKQIGMVASATQADRMLEDCLGGLRAGRELIAMRAARLALESATECALLACGNLHFGEALLWERVARTPALDESGLLETLLAPVVAAGVLVTAAMASHLVSQAVLDGWDRDLRRMPAMRPAVAGSWEVNPFYLVYRRSDSLGITGPDHGIRTNEATAGTWRNLQGAAPSDSAEERAFASKGLVRIASAADSIW